MDKWNEPIQQGNLRVCPGCGKLLPRDDERAHGGAVYAIRDQYGYVKGWVDTGKLTRSAQIHVESCPRCVQTTQFHRLNDEMACAIEVLFLKWSLPPITHPSWDMPQPLVYTAPDYFDPSHVQSWFNVTHAGEGKPPLLLWGNAGLIIRVALSGGRFRVNDSNGRTMLDISHPQAILFSKMTGKQGDQ